MHGDGSDGVDAGHSFGVLIVSGQRPICSDQLSPA